MYKPSLVERPLTAKQRDVLEAVARGDIREVRNHFSHYGFAPAVAGKVVSAQIKALLDRRFIRFAKAYTSPCPYELTVAGALELNFDASKLVA